MNRSEIKQAKVGDRVKYEPPPHSPIEYCEGTIIAVEPDAIVISWDDGDVHVTIPSNCSKVFFK